VEGWKPRPRTSKDKGEKMKLDPEIIKTYSEAIISFIDNTGYPFSIRSRFNLKEPENYIEMAKPKSLRYKFKPDQKARAIFHYHNEKLDKQRQLLLKGILNEKENKLIFTPQHVSETFPSVKIIDFISWGKAEVNKYFEKRGIKKPDLQLEKLVKEIKSE
jgi:hypothetical protein